MEDREIVALFLRREETALAEAGKNMERPFMPWLSGFFAIGRTAGRSWATPCWMLGIPFRRFCRPLRPVGSGLSNGKNRLLPLVPADTACRIKFSKDCGLVRTVQNRSPYPHKKRHSRSYTVFRKEFYAHFYAILFR